MEEDNAFGENIESEADFVGDDVTYLKDSWKQPSLNTLMQQCLSQTHLHSSNVDFQAVASSSRDIITNDQFLSDAGQSPAILEKSRAKESYFKRIVPRRSSRKTRCHKTSLKREYSPEIVHNPLKCGKSKQPKSIVSKYKTRNAVRRLPEINVLQPPSSTATSASVNFALDAPEFSLPVTNILRPPTSTATSALVNFALDAPEVSLPERNILRPPISTATSASVNFALVTPEVSLPEKNALGPPASTATSVSVNFDLEAPEVSLIDTRTLQRPSSTVTPVASLSSLALTCLLKKCNNKNLNVNRRCIPVASSFSPNFVLEDNHVIYESNGSNETETHIDNFDPFFEDFSPDEDSDYQPDLDICNSSHTSCESVLLHAKSPEKIRKRAKRGQADKENWKSEVNKSKRMKGENYKGRRTAEDGKHVFDVERNKRFLKTRCEHDERCKYFDCYKITDDERKQTFDRFWTQSWEAKRVWVQQTVQKQTVARRKCIENNNRRQNTFKYNLNVSGRRLKVCKKMYLNTLDLGEWSVHNWTEDLKKSLPERPPNKRNINTKTVEEFGRHYVKEFLNELPKLESHYCRKSTSKLYLEPLWQSKQSLFREYQKRLTDTGKLEFKVSKKIFLAEFETLNLSLFSPKKDQCDFCCAYNVGNVLEEDYIMHIAKKDAARAEKTRDKNLTDPTVKVYTFDLQAVLLSPSLKASALYYKTKLKVHNFTIFDIQTKDAFCFIWNESEGGVNADEFASILHHFIYKYVAENIKHVIFWSDGCTNQNRNAILSNALLQVAVNKSIKITHKYLEKGHTQMECDSMHSTIERQLKNREIYFPGQYVEVCRTARLNKPYVVEYLQHSFFKRFSTLPYVNSIRPGKRAGEATVFAIRCIEYRDNGKIYTKKAFSDEFEELARKIKKPSQIDYIPILYDSRLLIPRNKYVHLQELKEVLPRDVHVFYDELPHVCPDQRRNNCSCKKN